jgi:hypothetical protein
LVSFRSDPELLWENGQIVTHGRSARPTSTTKFPQTTAAGAARGASIGNGFSNSKANNDIMADDARADADDENMVPWIHCSLHDHDHDHQPLPLPSSPLPSDDFCSDFFEGFAGASPASLSFGFGFTPPQSVIAAPAAAAAAAVADADADAELSKGDTSVTNFSLFKDRLASGARASTSTKHTHAPAPAPADQKDTTKLHDQPLLPFPVASSSVCSVNVNDEGGHSTKSPEPKHASKRKILEADDSSSNTEVLAHSLLIYTSTCTCKLYTINVYICQIPRKWTTTQKEKKESRLEEVRLQRRAVQLKFIICQKE